MTLSERRHGISVLAGVPAVIASLGVVAGALSAPAYATMPMPQDEEAAQDEGQEATDQARGEQALAEGRAALANSEWRNAITAYRRALQFLPGNAEAEAGIARAQAALDRGGIGEQTAEELELLRQRAMAEFDAALANSRQLLQQGQYDQAQNTLITARVALDRRQNILQAGEYQQRTQQAEQLLNQINEARRIAEAERIAREQADIEKARDIEEERQMRLRQEQINQNLVQVRELQLRQDYVEALNVIDNILFLDENNPVALTLRDAIQTALLWQNFIKSERQREFNISYQFQEAREATIPPRPNFGPGPKSTTGIMVYPEDWPHLSIRRTSDAGYVDTDANRRVAVALNQTTLPVDFQNARFEQVLAFMKQVTGVNVVADWKALDFIGVHPDDPVTLSLAHDVSAETVLDQVLGQLGGEIDRPRYAIQDGLLVVSSEDAIRKHVVTVVYDIRDLLFEVPYFDNAPDLDLVDAALNGGRSASPTVASMQGVGNDNGTWGGGSQHGGQGNSIFSDPGTAPDRRTRTEVVDQIVSLIQSTVDRDGWTDLGGDTGVVQELNGNLVITQTPRAQREIQGLLSQLREIRALQINIESRFLTVDMDWFEKIGFDLDLYFNTNNTMFQQARAIDPNFQLGDFFDQRGRLKDPLIFGNPNEANDPALPPNTFGSGAFFGVPTGDFTNGFGNTQYLVGPLGQPIRNRQGFSPIGITQDGMNLVDLLGGFGADTFAGTILTNNPAVTLAVQFLDDVQVDLLIEATQADRRNVLLTAPRLTLFNGQRAWVAVGQRRAFVSGLVPIVGDNSGAFAPQIDILTDGVVLDVEAVISADRRYVTLTVITGLAEIVRIDTLEFSGGVGGGGLGGGSATFQGSIGLPVIEVSRVNTTVSVPDKGTVLLGGQRLVEEVEVEVGVPVLSKIPFINRFFTNRVTSKSESTLLILIRPEIIIQQENEDLLFPGLSDTLGSGSF